MAYWFYIPISEELASKLDALDELPMAVQRSKLERAIHAALDAEGWPQGESGESVSRAPFYVVLFRHGEIQGHVGPINDPRAANRCMSSWKQAPGMRAVLDRKPKGPCLTNAGVQPRDIYYL